MGFENCSRCKAYRQHQVPTNIFWGKTGLDGGFVCLTWPCTKQSRCPKAGCDGARNASLSTWGIAALLKGAHIEWSPAFRSAIMTTASPFDNTQNYILDLGLDRKFAAPLAMGAGQVKPNGALSSSLI
ncbi:subtilisin-like protease, partial [Olea europaea subsp. europaea]